MSESVTRQAKRCCSFVPRIKITDAAKLQDEYAKLVEGLQEESEPSEEDAIMGNPGTLFTPLASSCLQSPSSSTRRFAQRSHTGKYSKGRAFRILLEEIRRISQGETTSE
jgi:hypothetical protein